MRSPPSSSAELRHVTGCRIAAALLSSLAASCAHQRARPPARLAVAPVDTLGVKSEEGGSLRRALQREARRARTVRPAPLERVDRAAAATECRDSAACLARLGRRVSSDLVLSATIAGLGRMRLVRARLVRTRDGLVVQDLQRTIHGGGGRSFLGRAAGDLIGRLFPERRGKAWYGRWWIWSALAGAVAAAVGVTWWAVASSGQEERDPNVVHVGDL